MEKLIIEPTNETPQVNFNGDFGFFSISGKSYPENATSFYKPLFDYIELYKSTPHEKTTIEFKWLYYNTSTSKMIVKIIMLLKNVSKEFEINWICKKEFDVIIQKGNELKEILEINLNIKYE